MVLQSSMSNVSIIFGYPALPIRYPEDEYLSPVLPLYFSNPDVIRASAEILSRTEQNLGFYVSVVLSTVFLINTLRPSKGAVGKYHHEHVKSTSKETFLTFFIGIVVIPFVIIVTSISILYRFLVHRYLSITNGQNYVGMLKGPDVLWAISSPEARSAVNVLVVIEVPPPRRGSSTSYDFLHFMRKIAARSLLPESTPYPKLLYRRAQSRLGYYFWEKHSSCSVEDYVRSIPMCKISNDSISEANLQDIIAQYSNSPFPFDDTATWELLVGQKPLQTTEAGREFPIIFRVHHSVGDGVALLRLLLEGLVDDVEYKTLPAKVKQKIWAQSGPKTKEEKNTVEPQPLNSTSGDILLDLGANNNKDLERIPTPEPVVTMNSGGSVIRFRRQSFSSTSNEQDPLTKTLPLSRLRNSFRFLRHSPVKAVQKHSLEEAPKSESLPSIPKSYAPIKGLGCGSLRTKFPIISRTSKIVNSNEFKKSKNASSVLLEAKKIEENVCSFDNSACEPDKKHFQELPLKEGSKIYYYRPERSLITHTPKFEEDSTSKGLKTEEKEHNDEYVFEKCKVTNRRIQNDCLLSNVVEKEVKHKPMPYVEKDVSTKISTRDVFLNTIIAVVLSIVCIKNSLKCMVKKSSTALKTAGKFCCKIPHVLYTQTFARTEDRLLFGKPLTGRKVISWLVEGDDISEENLIKQKIKKIRERLGGNITFSEILMTCVSRSLKTFYQRHGGEIPPSVNVVLPARVNYDDLSKGLETTSIYQTSRFTAKVTRVYSSRKKMKSAFKWQNVSFNSCSESEPEDLKQERMEHIHQAISSPSKIKHNAEMENKFTIAILPLPIETSSTKERELKEDLKLIRQVQEQCRRLRNAPDYAINYWLLKWTAHVFPSFLVKPFLSGGPCTLVLSNMPGPEDPVYLMGKPIRKIIFWVPNRGLNGLGIGILSYCGRFSMGVMADEAIISNKEEAKEVISGIFDEVERLASYCKPNSQDWSPNLNNPIKNTPAKYSVEV